MSILVLGAGVMGSAFTVPLCDAGGEVRLVGTHLDGALIDGVRTNGVHPKLKAPLPSSLRSYHYHDLPGLLDERVELVVLGVSSAGIDWAIEQLRPLEAKRPILLLTKGLIADGERIDTLPPHVEAALGCPAGAVGGPCIAGELAVRRHSSVQIGFADKQLAEATIARLDAPYYHARPTDDLLGLELCAALKNFYALGVGAALGQLDAAAPAVNGARMHNHAAGLFTQALRELAHIVEALSGSDDMVRGLPGTGDLYVTAQAGRNSRMGRLLGAGWPYRKAKAERMPEETVEGAELALACGPSLRAMMDSGDLDAARLPLACAILDAVCDDTVFTVPWQAFER